MTIYIRDRVRYSRFFGCRISEVVALTLIDGELHTTHTVIKM